MLSISVTSSVSRFRIFCSGRRAGGRMNIKDCASRFSFLRWPDRHCAWSHGPTVVRDLPRTSQDLASELCFPQSRELSKNTFPTIFFRVQLATCLSRFLFRNFWFAELCAQRWVTFQFIFITLETQLKVARWMTFSRTHRRGERSCYHLNAFFFSQKGRIRCVIPYWLRVVLSIKAAGPRSSANLQSPRSKNVMDVWSDLGGEGLLFGLFWFAYWCMNYQHLRGNFKY